MNCKNCGQHIPQRPGPGAHRKYCSDSCRSDWYRYRTRGKEVVRPWHKCLVCERVFFSERANRKYCSAACGTKAKRHAIECDFCGKTFYRASTRPRFCSIACGQKNRRAIETCVGCGAEFPHRGTGQNSYCSFDCYLRTRGKKRTGRKFGTDVHHRRRAKKAGVPHESVSIEYVYERDGGKCHICGKKVSTGYESPHPMSLSLDHLIPLSRGGGHLLNNVCISHLGCNVGRKTRANGEQLLLVG